MWGCVGTMACMSLRGNGRGWGWAPRCWSAPTPACYAPTRTTPKPITSSPRVSRFPFIIGGNNEGSLCRLLGSSGVRFWQSQGSRARIYGRRSRCCPWTRWRCSYRTWWAIHFRRDRWGIRIVVPAAQDGRKRTAAVEMSPLRQDRPVPHAIEAVLAQAGARRPSLAELSTVSDRRTTDARTVRDTRICTRIHGDYCITPAINRPV